MRHSAILLILFILSIAGLSAQSIQVLQKGKDTSLRGLSVVDDSVAWVSGSKGWTAISKDGGKTWKNLSESSFHTVRKAKSGKLVLLTGGNGRIAIYQD